VLSDDEEIFFRESVFAWLRAKQLVTPYLTRDDVAQFPWQGRTLRLLGPQTGIWKISGLSDAAIAFSTSFVPDGKRRPYEDDSGPDGLLRYKWRGTDPDHADNRALRRAMERGLPLVYFVGVGYRPGTQTQWFDAQYPVFLVAEESAQHQFAVAYEVEQRPVPDLSDPAALEITKRYNERIVTVRHHQPESRGRVISAYESRCAVCRLPFAELLDAAHIKPDSEGGSARVSNGLSLCKIHHGAYDTEILGISPDLKIHIRQSVLETFDGPTLQHALKEMDGETLRQIPRDKLSRPDRELLSERFERFRAAS
jgi:putative restriction endonuclease